MVPENTIREILRCWNVDLKCFHPRISVSGSPERTDLRIVVEDSGNKFYVLEKIYSRDVNKKKQIAQSLEFLSRNGMSKIRPYLIDRQGSCLCCYDDDYWQLGEYVEGVDLDREQYIFESWRGNAIAEFLLDLKKSSVALPFFDRSNVFSLKQYIYDLLKPILNKKPGIFKRVQPIIDFLERDFMMVYDDFMTTFCHGDCHPINIIWGNKEILAVIDWEFVGYKPEIYDVANLVGCVGMENPECLNEGLIMSFLFKMRDSGIVSEHSWKYLLEFIVALRFAWLSEWLRKSDEEMQELELVYMNLLIKNAEDLKACWFSDTVSCR